MAIAVTNLITGSSVLADPTTGPITPTPGAHVLLWVGCSVPSGNPPDLLNVSGGGATWTELSTGQWRVRRRGWLYIGAGFTGTDGIHLDYSGVEPEEFTWIIDEATGLNSETPVFGTNQNFDPDSTNLQYPVSVLGVPAGGQVTYSCVQLENVGVGLAAAGFTELAEELGNGLGVRQAKTAVSMTAETLANWSWAGGDEGGGSVITILSDVNTGSNIGLRQAVTDRNTTNLPISVSFSFPPIEGNLLIAAMCERADLPDSDAIESPTGYTRIGYNRVSEGDGTHRRGMAIYYKIAEAGEGVEVVGGFTPAYNNSIMTIMEITGIGALGSGEVWQYENMVWTDNGSVSNDTILATNDIVTTGPSALVAIVAYKSGVDDPGPEVGLSVGFTNGFANLYNDYQEDSYLFVTGVGLARETAAGTFNTTTTLIANIDTNRGIHIALLNFSAVGGELPTAVTDSPAIMGACF